MIPKPSPPKLSPQSLTRWRALYLAEISCRDRLMKFGPAYSKGVKAANEVIDYIRTTYPEVIK